MSVLTKIRSGAEPPSAWLRAFGNPGRLLQNVGPGALALIDQAFVSGTRFLTTVLIGRFCGVDALGVYSLAFVFVVLPICLQESLVSTPFTVFAGRERGRPLRILAGSALAQFAILSLIATCCLVLLGAALTLVSNLAPLAGLLWILAAVMPFCLLREFARRFEFTQMDMRTALAVDGGAAILQIGGLLALNHFRLLTPGSAFAVMGFACGVSALAWLRFERVRFRPRREALWSHFARSAEFGKWLCAAQLLGTVHASVIEWLLMLQVGAAATGRYVACLTLVLICNPFIMGVCNFVAPQAARAISGGPAGVRRVIVTTSLLFGVVMGAFCAVLNVCGNQLLYLLFGDGFAGGYMIAVLSMCCFCWAQTASVSCGLAAIQRTNVNFRASFAGLAVTVLAAPPLILAGGSLGGAGALLCGSLTTAAVNTFAFLRLTR